ncbi:glycosyltransferase family 2 protein [Leptolyngbya sp. FACHB-541]|uniref:hormogonium polysaccharide biosynthesis glycosyltransferase HpsE n=1 Tax=Leptolyngbya sp. FACHB-541 TaxID=2692810 RepID=UPI001685913C|nr:hormogonium polysaccharide biosynthesis glycosyltransferase HpsE [Leptolyngbya sp. FACHB-541]MBD1996151.1 glycosyltransferase family 2 protein [Leptolyngbya sp. FACHB-541]
MVDLTVAIPTYNGAQRLPDVLEALKSQTGTEAFTWEVLVVDNNSRDTTAEVVKAYQQDSPYPVRYCLEAMQGAGFARKRAIQEAQSGLIGFLDDDNIPHANWIAAAYAFAQEHPNAGAIASRIQGEFEVEPPEEFNRLLSFLALTERGPDPLIYEPAKKVLPPSAGLVIRKQAWIENVPDRLILNGRVDGNMLTAEDLEMLSYIQRSGWEIWYNPAMQVRHKIPKQRLEREYLIPFFRGIGLSRYVTRMLSVQPWQRSPALIAYTLNDIRKITLHLLKHRTKVKTDLVAACELELFTSSLISPFYLWRKGYLSSKKT